MTISVFASGLVLGLSIAAPVGPMGLLCINRTLQRGLLPGLCVGAGIATGDAAYGAVAAFGFTAVTNLLVSLAGPLRIVGGAFLIWMGVQAWRMAGVPRSARATPGGQSLIRDYLAAVGLTLTNPATILSFIAAFGALDLAQRGGGAPWLVAGVFVGSAAWWAGLCTAVASAGHALTPAAMAWIDRGSAVILVLFGITAAAGLL
jgi:putative LysE/RhtB family amino acid efflux pump